MKAVLKNIFSVLLAAVVITTTSGFMVFKHHCNTQRSTEYSVLVPAFECDHYNHKHSEKLPSCCALPEAINSESCSTDDCCETDSFIVKLDIKIDNHDISKKIQFETHIEPLYSVDIVKQVSDEISHIIISDDLPPPKSGKALRIYLHQLNIPFPSV